MWIVKEVCGTTFSSLAIAIIMQENCRNLQFQQKLVQVVVPPVLLSCIDCHGISQDVEIGCPKWPKIPHSTTKSGCPLPIHSHYKNLNFRVSKLKTGHPKDTWIPHWLMPCWFCWAWCSLFVVVNGYQIASETQNINSQISTVLSQFSQSLMFNQIPQSYNLQNRYGQNWAVSKVHTHHLLSLALLSGIMSVDGRTGSKLSYMWNV